MGREELDEVVDSFERNWLTSGPKVEKFEREVAEFVGAPFGIAVSNGTVALDIVLKILGIGPGDEVIVPAMTYFATAAAVSYQHAVPVFTDIEGDSFNLDPKRVCEAITDKTKAILFIDYGGNPSDVDVNMGAQTNISTMSFHMAKVMTCVEGGMVFTHSEEFKEQVVARRNQGEPPNMKYKHVVLGTNARMTDMQAGIGLAQLRRLPTLLEGRRRVAERYKELLSASGMNVTTITTRPENSRNAFFFFPILIDDRDRIADVLRDKHGIDTRVAYPMPVYEQELYASGGAVSRAMACPVAEDVTSRILNLPIFPDMSTEMIESVVEAIRDAVGS